MAETLKAEAQRDHADLKMKTTGKPSKSTTGKTSPAKSDAKESQTEKIEAEELKKFDDDNLSDEYAELDDIDDDADDNADADEDEEHLIDDEEEVMMECPDHCRCSGQYNAAMTATYVSVSNRIII